MAALQLIINKIANSVMEMNRLTREADELIRKVVARYNSLYSPGGTLSQLELDLLLDDLRLMYDKFKILGQLNQQHKQQESNKIVIPEQEKTIKADAPLLPEKKDVHPITPPAAEDELYAESVGDIEQQVDSFSSPEDRGDVEAKIEDQPISEIQSDDQPALPFDQKPYQTLEQEGVVQTIADKFKNSQKSLSEVMFSENNESIGSRLGHHAVADIKSFIGLAEKFSFINELFGGDPLAYEKAIVQLNGATRLTEAEAYLGTLRLNHKWPADSSQATLLNEIIRRKFNA